MTFEEALHWLKNGGKMATRECWINPDHKVFVIIEWPKEGSHYTYPVLSVVNGNHLYPYIPDAADMFANDWQVFN